MGRQKSIIEKKHLKYLKQHLKSNKPVKSNSKRRIKSAYKQSKSNLIKEWTKFEVSPGSGYNHQDEYLRDDYDLEDYMDMKAGGLQLTDYCTYKKQELQIDT